MSSYTHLLICHMFPGPIIIRLHLFLVISIIASVGCPGTDSSTTCTFATSPIRCPLALTVTWTIGWIFGWLKQQEETNDNELLILQMRKQ